MCIILTLLIFLRILTSTAVSVVVDICPVGFNLIYRNDYSDPICFRRKGPETFYDKFTDCAGNLFSYSLYRTLNFLQPNYTLWTDYKSQYPGGPFIDWSYTQSMGDKLTPYYKVNYDARLELDEELCVLIHPLTNFTAARCSEKHYRYCFVKAGEPKQDLSTVGCEDLSLFDYYRFWSPRPTCLSSDMGKEVGVTWHQAQELCVERKGQLISTGWRYMNSPLFDYKSIPFGITLSADNSTIKFANENITVSYLHIRIDLKTGHKLCRLYSYLSLYFSDN